MSLVTQIEKRRASRALDTRPVPRETLLRLAQAAHVAPSCMNSQPWRIVTVVEPGRLAELKAALTPGNYWAQKAPAITAFVVDVDWDARLDNGRDYAFFDLGLAAMNYQIQAIGEGLVAHPIAGFNAAAAREVLGIPEKAVLVALVILGYPGDPAALNEKHQAAEKAGRSRKDLDDVFTFDAWDQRLVPPAKASA